SRNSDTCGLWVAHLFGSSLHIPVICGCPTPVARFWRRGWALSSLRTPVACAPPSQTGSLRLDFDHALDPARNLTTVLAACADRSKSSARIGVDRQLSSA